MEPICRIKTPFHEKFGVPRQSLLVMEAKGVMSFPKNDFFSEAFRGIEESPYLWLIFQFDQIPDGPFNGLVRPPRFENKLKMGVYATRSPHRPNRLGLSLVKFENLEVLPTEIRLTVAGVDLVDGTPIFDIKPYVPYVEGVAAKSVFSSGPSRRQVVWLCSKIQEASLIENVISLDPRPAQDRESSDEFGLSIAGHNVRFRQNGDVFEIIKADRLD